MSALGIHTIVVATDLTDELIPAVQTAARLAQLTDAQLHIMHTTETPVPEARMTEHLAAGQVALTDRIEARIVVGPPGAAITQEALRLQASVIVLGPHRPGSSRLGSTAYRVLRGAQTPCLMLPVHLTLPVRSVMVPLDISTSAPGALVVALTWSSALRGRDRNRPTRLDALHVTDGSETSESAAQRLHEDVEAVCKPFKELCAGVEISTAILEGAPADAILRVAQRDDTDLIVMGTRGMDLKDAELGSVSLEIVTRAQQPVLLVPPDIWQRAPRS